MVGSKVTAFTKIRDGSSRKRTAKPCAKTGKDETQPFGEDWVCSLEKRLRFSEASLKVILSVDEKIFGGYSVILLLGRHGQRVSSPQIRKALAF